MNINIGPPYEASIKKIIDKGYAGNQTEVIRQAISAYERMLAEREEAELVEKAVEAEMAEIRSGRAKTHTFGEIRKILEK